jgi:hypothetical protein
MKACSFTLEYYISESSRIPFKAWLEGLKDIACAKEYWKAFKRR